MESEPILIPKLMSSWFGSTCIITGCDAVSVRDATKLIVDREQTEQTSRPPRPFVMYQAAFRASHVHRGWPSGASSSQLSHSGRLRRLYISPLCFLSFTLTGLIAFWKIWQYCYDRRKLQCFTHDTSPVSISNEARYVLFEYLSHSAATDSLHTHWSMP